MPYVLTKDELEQAVKEYITKRIPVEEDVLTVTIEDKFGGAANVEFGVVGTKAPAKRGPKAKVNGSQEFVPKVREPEEELEVTSGSAQLPQQTSLPKVEDEPEKEEDIPPTPVAPTRSLFAHLAKPS